MSIIKASVQINAPADRVWEIISDIDNEPTFWKGTKSVRNISREHDRVVREITIAFKDKKCMQEVVLKPKQSIKATFTKGIIKGTKTIEISSNGSVMLTAIWDIALSGMMVLFSGMISKHIRNGTEQALDLIKKAAES